MRKELNTIFRSDVPLPEIVQQKAALAFEEIKNREQNTAK